MERCIWGLVAKKIPKWAALGYTLFTTSALSAGQKIVVTGSSTVAPLVAEIARLFETQHPQVKVDVQTGGSSKGITDCRTELADIGMVSRVLKDDEKDLSGTPIARDGLAIVAHKDVAIEKLTSQQVRDLATGTITRWSAIGGPDLKVVFVSKAEGRATLDLFLDHFKLKGSQLKPSLVIGDEEQGVKTISQTPGSFGFLALSSLGEAKDLKGISLDNVRPTLENLRSNRYPVSRPLQLITCGPTKQEAHAFISFARSELARKLILDLGLQPL